MAHSRRSLKIGSTGYFYALDNSKPHQSIQDAAHIYNVANITDRHLPPLIEIDGALDHFKVALLINGYVHKMCQADICARSSAATRRSSRGPR